MCSLCHSLAACMHHRLCQGLLVAVERPKLQMSSSLSFSLLSQSFFLLSLLSRD